MGTGAVGTSTARQARPATSTGSELDNSASTDAPPGPPKWHHTGVSERAPPSAPPAGFCCSRPTMRCARSHTVRTSGMRRSSRSTSSAMLRPMARSINTPSSRMAKATMPRPIK